jgi:hypothetical protein
MPATGAARSADAASDNGLPEDIREHMRLMCDIVALGFQTDKTRVATLLLCRDLSGLFYPFLDVRLAHHPASHDDQSDAYERVSRYYCSQFAYLASKLDAMREGEGTVLDNSCFCSCQICGLIPGMIRQGSRAPGEISVELRDRKMFSIKQMLVTTIAKSLAALFTFPIHGSNGGRARSFRR